MTDLDLNPITGKLDLVSSTTIGLPIVGGAPARVLFTDASGNLAVSPDFVYDADNLGLKLTKDLSNDLFTVFTFGSDLGSVFNGQPFGAHWENSTAELQWRDSSGYYYGQRIGALTCDFVYTNGVQSANLTNTRIPYSSASGYLIDSANMTFNGTRLSLATTGATGGISIGNDTQLYRDTADTLFTPDRIRSETSTTITSGDWIGISSSASTTASADSTSRHWGMQFNAISNGSFNYTSSNGAIVGLEGYGRHNGTGTNATVRGGMMYAHNANTGTVTDALGLLVWTENSNAAGTVTTGTVLRISSFGGANPNFTSHRGIRIGNPAFTANNQTRIGIIFDAMPSPGAFTGTTCYAIDIAGTSRASRDGIRFGGDVDLFSGAANRLDLGAGDSFYIPNDSNGFALGTTPNAIYTSNNRRTTTAALSTNPAVVNCEFLINHGVTGFPSAMRMFVPINAGANNVGYAAGISSQVSVQNGHSAQANNITAADFSARWNTNQATASSNSLLGARIYTTSDNATISGSVSNLFGGSFEAGVNTAATTLTINSSIIAGQFLVRVPQAGAGTAIAFGSDFPNHSIGTSAPINVAGHIRLAPLTAAYGSGTRYPLLFNGTNTNPNEIGIWWGTDANNVNLYRSGNNELRTDDRFRAQLGVTVPGTTGATFTAVSNTTAPTTTTGGTPDTYFGNPTSTKTYLGEPIDWLLVNVNGADRKIPLY